MAILRIALHEDAGLSLNASRTENFKALDNLGAFLLKLYSFHLFGYFFNMQTSSSRADMTHTHQIISIISM